MSPYRPPVSKRKSQIDERFQNFDGSLKKQWHFYTWLMNQKDRADFTGTFCRVIKKRIKEDIRHGSICQVPVDSIEYKAWKNYVYKVGGETTALLFLAESWRNYEKFLKENKCPERLYDVLKIKE